MLRGAIDHRSPQWRVRDRARAPGRQV